MSENTQKTDPFSVASAAGEEKILQFASSAMFTRLFDEGMALVEETAAYLDGPGREDSKTLPRRIALAYAGESMRLTTRLMQVASWLLVQKAIAEGEMEPSEALSEKHRLGGQDVCRPAMVDGYEDLPLRLKELLDESERLYDRVERLDSSLYIDHEPMPVVVNDALDRLRDAFS